MDTSLPNSGGNYNGWSFNYNSTLLDPSPSPVPSASPSTAASPSSTPSTSVAPSVSPTPSVSADPMPSSSASTPPTPSLMASSSPTPEVSPSSSNSPAASISVPPSFSPSVSPQSGGSSKHHNGVSGGTVAAITIPLLGVAIVGGVVGFFLFRKYRRRTQMWKKVNAEFEKEELLSDNEAY
mmetsp:Transcript_1783/g.2297  ORF Transcript_1783/g.2297 Transcript_1783/m.2297 type:complete len:181 (-) Transcript_1783:21-563(-)